MSDSKGQYKHKQDNKRISQIVVIDSDGLRFSTQFDPNRQPQIGITYGKAEPDAGTSPGDDIIVRGGSLQILCGKNHGPDCLGTNDNRGQYKHRISDAYVTRVIVRDSKSSQLANFRFDPAQVIRPEEARFEQIEITYKAPAAKPSPTPPVEPVRPQVEAVSPPPVFPDAPATDYDLDQFASFDVLPRATPEESLIERGPRLPREYATYFLEMRAFVQGGTPMVIDYELNSDAPADLIVSVGNLSRWSSDFNLPSSHNGLSCCPIISAKSRKLVSCASQRVPKKTCPQPFAYMGSPMGQIGAQALDNLISVPLYTELAIANQNFGPVHSYGPLALSAFSSPQTGPVIKIMVSPPTTITTGLKPKQAIAFSFTARSLFDNGRWELLKVEGLNETHVWQKRIGRIEPNETLSEKWYGEIDYLGKVSTGDHSLKVVAWRGDASRAFVIARAPGGSCRKEIVFWIKVTAGYSQALESCR